MGEPDTSRHLHSRPLQFFFCQQPQNTRSCLTNGLECPQITLQHVPQPITAFRCSVLFDSCWLRSAHTVSWCCHRPSTALNDIPRFWSILLASTTLTKGLGVDCIPPPVFFFYTTLKVLFWGATRWDGHIRTCWWRLYCPFRRRDGLVLDGTWCAIFLFVSRFFSPVVTLVNYFWVA